VRIPKHAHSYNLVFAEGEFYIVRGANVLCLGSMPDVLFSHACSAGGPDHPAAGGHHRPGCADSLANPMRGHEWSAPFLPASTAAVGASVPEASHKEQANRNSHVKRRKQDVHAVPGMGDVPCKAYSAIAYMAT
jgi:hypothetical protein